MIRILQRIVGITLLHEMLVTSAFNSSWLNLTYVTMTGITCLKCPPGTYWVADCTEDYHVSTCRMCPENYFSDSYNRADTCHPCSSKCSVLHMVITSPCSGMSDAACECPEGHYYSRRKKGNIEACYPHTKCDKGYGVTRIGTKANNTICEACRPGCTYSDKTSSTDRCQDCRSCGLFEVLLECGSGHDTVCGIQEMSEDYTRNKTLGIPNVRGQDFPLVVVLILVFSIVLFVLILVLIKLYCWRQKYNVMKGMNASHLYTDHSSLQYAYAQDGMSSFYFSDASSIAPSMRSRTTRSVRSMRPISEIEDKSMNGSILTMDGPHWGGRGRHRDSRSTLNLQLSSQDDDWEARYDSIFSFLARKLSPHWKSLVTRLFIGIGDKQAYTYTKQLESEVRSTREKMHEGLLEWKHRGGDAATPGKLLAALYILDFHNVIAHLRNKYPAVFNNDDDDDDSDDDRETDV
ncbi:uncharacterized protein [Argopecten irradians]|uniref:uncharacterized protein n=1 Tax=Argopecten irradians TaxID=31199 RepID=UPI00371A4534